MQDHLDKIKYRYYKLNQDVEFSIRTDCEFVCVRPSISNIHQLIWTMLSLGKYRRCELVVQGEIVSTAEVMPKMPFFCFMPSNGIHIGPCATKPECRGKGYYPQLLRMIVAAYSPKECYIFCNSNNKASIRGIEKAGGVMYANGYKSKFGFYRIKEFVAFY